MSWPQNQPPQNPPQQPGFGPPPGAWQPGPAGSPPQPPPTSKWLLFGAVVGVLALTGVSVGIALLVDDGEGGSERAKESQGSPRTSASKSLPPASADGPMVKGWQTQTRDEHHFRYDVPATSQKWQVLDDDTALSYNDDNGKPIVVMTGAGNYREGGCSSAPNPDSIGEAGKGQLATVGTTGGGTQGTLQENARNWAGNWGYVAYGGDEHKPRMKVGQAKPWKLNGIDGWTATAEVTVTHRPSPCVPPKAVVHSIAQKLPDGTMHGWVIYADQGVPHALTDAQIEKIMKTVRPVTGED
ncbi:hypothetical protein [Streptomyces sp. NPDC047108]|uniref:hypothetical protein n=1 Tax=Streptomyces sp. NPDC047108 TaxID=3155025 RepID=UPI0033EE1003